VDYCNATPDHAAVIEREMKKRRGERRKKKEGWAGGEKSRHKISYSGLAAC